MYVLMDIEWFTNKENHVGPTQIAAIRVDDQWNAVDRFYERIKPRDVSFHDWDHVAYAGGTSNEFLQAKNLRTVLASLRGWFSDNDVLCWWHEEAKTVLNSMFMIVRRERLEHDCIYLNKYVRPYLASKGMVCTNPHEIAKAYGMQRFKPRHHSMNDALALQTLLQSISFPSSMLEGPAPAMPEKRLKESSALTAEWPYQVSVVTGVLHRKDCCAIHQDESLLGFMSVKPCAQAGYKGCPICGTTNELHAYKREKNAEMLKRTSYRYVFTQQSKVFHRPECGIILNVDSLILGMEYYDRCCDSGRRPCKICHPETGKQYLSRKARREVTGVKVLGGKSAIPTRQLNKAERRSVQRFEQARIERLAHKDKEFATPEEKNDFFTLTQPRFSFWSASGYDTFHLRSCKKLKNMSGLIGFSKYKEATRTGRKPCRFCNPSDKHDIYYSVPITNLKRNNESIRDLEELCKKHGYHFSMHEDAFIFDTPVGRWKINMTTKPYIVHHINRVMQPDNEDIYHRQPRLFLSLIDTFSYIHRHDVELRERITASKEKEDQFEVRESG